MFFQTKNGKTVLCPSRWIGNVVKKKKPEKYSGRILGANLHYKDAVELVTEGAAVVCLAVEQEVTACTSRNVVARIEGKD